MAFTEKVVLHAYEVTPEDIDTLHRHGFSDADILDIVLTTSYRCLLGKMVDALGFPPPSQWLKGIEEALGKQLYQALQVGRVYSQAD